MNLTLEFRSIEPMNNLKLCCSLPALVPTSEVGTACAIISHGERSYALDIATGSLLDQTSFFQYVKVLSKTIKLSMLNGFISTLSYV